MEMQVGQQLHLLDAGGRELGLMTVEEREGELLGGRFDPKPGFRAVEPLFREFEEAVNAQALHAADRYEAAIAALGMCLREAGAEERLCVRDVQIWSDGGMTCRLASASIDALNGSSVEHTPAPERSCKQ